MFFELMLAARCIVPHDCTNEGRLGYFGGIDLDAQTSVIGGSMENTGSNWHDPLVLAVERKLWSARDVTVGVDGGIYFRRSVHPNEVNEAPFAAAFAKVQLVKHLSAVLRVVPERGAFSHQMYSISLRWE